MGNLRKKKTYSGIKCKAREKNQFKIKLSTFSILFAKIWMASIGFRVLNWTFIIVAFIAHVSIDLKVLKHLTTFSLHWILIFLFAFFLESRFPARIRAYKQYKISSVSMELIYLDVEKWTFIQAYFDIAFTPPKNDSNFFLYKIIWCVLSILPFQHVNPSALNRCFQTFLDDFRACY